MTRDAEKRLGILIVTILAIGAIIIFIATRPPEISEWAFHCRHILAQMWKNPSWEPASIEEYTHEDRRIVRLSWVNGGVNEKALCRYQPKPWATIDDIIFDVRSGTRRLSSERLVLEDLAAQNAYSDKKMKKWWN